MVIHAEYDDSSCGDFGRRFDMDLIIGDECFHLWEDRVSSYSDDEVVEQYDRNCDILDKIYEMTGVESYIVDAVAEAIECTAYNRYCAEHEV